MDIFEYVSILTSIIIGLGIAHLLQGIARLIQHPGRERVYWVHLVWVAYMFIQAIFWWWWEFRLGDLKTWTFQIYIFVIMYAVVIYLMCALLFPVSLDEHHSFKDYYYSFKVWFFGLFVISNLIDLGDTWLKGQEYFSSLGGQYVIYALTSTALCIIAAVTRYEKFHQAWAIAAIIYQMYWALSFYETVG